MDGVPDYCVPAEPGALQDIIGTPAGTYLVRQPANADPKMATILFLPGGTGTARGAHRIWDNYLSGDPRVEYFRVIIPYSPEIEIIEEMISDRIFRILDEVLKCYGGDSSKVHLAGFSNGGVVAFALMLREPERFVTLLGAPGEFQVDVKPQELAKGLAGHAVFNGVGALDDDWKDAVKEAHSALQAVGIDSVYVEFPNQRHAVNAAFDESVFFDFWLSHSQVKLPDPCEAP